jgi:hypothetical protein
MNRSQFFAELKRGNIRRLTVAYATAGSLLIAAAALLVETFAAAAQGMKLLVRSARKGLKRLLHSADYESEVFKGTSDFLAHPPHPGPSCVIVDVKMPGLNASQFSVPDALGNANVDGSLRPVLVNGFTPIIGESFTFLDYATLTGAFSGLNSGVCEWLHSCLPWRFSALPSRAH